jgi:aminoglycoside phosphotransferase (APT) family kinase protein
VAGTDALHKEAEAIRNCGQLLPPPLTAPRILGTGGGVLLLEPVAWRPRERPWHLEPEVGRAVGAFYRRGVDARRGEGFAHGDFAPWNLLETDQGLVLLDWESAREDAPPFFDLCHFLVQSHTLLGQPSWEHLVNGFRRGDGWVGAAVRAYADGAELSAEEAMAALESYLLTTAGSMDADGERAGGRTRHQLLRQLGR